MRKKTYFMTMIVLMVCGSCQSINSTDSSLENTSEPSKTTEDTTSSVPTNENMLSDGNEFVIYLVDVSSLELTQMEWSSLECSGESVITTDDIVTYSWEKHELHLTSSANRRLAQMQSEIIRKYGLPFVACVGNKPIYGGALWTSYSSAIFEGIVIDVYPTEHNEAIIVQLGYPLGMFEDMEDPRSNPMIFDALERAGKLQ